MPFAILQVGMSGLYALSLSVIVAAVYLAVVRFMDPNEKEPLWAVGILFFFGALAAAILPLFVSSVVRELGVVTGAISEEVARFVAFSSGTVVLAAVASSRRWTEIGGLMDGVVYGTAVGFGFATGTSFIRELASGQALAGADVGVGPFATLWTTALLGLSDGLFGAIIGAAVGARSAAPRFGYPALGLVGAIVVHALYLVLARGDSLGGTAGLVRTWVALAMPVVFVVAVVVIALGRERRAIREELAGEEASGVVTEEELKVLQSFVARRALYAKTLLKRDFDGWLALRALHNRQVQLALAKRRVRSREGDPEARAGGEVGRLRASVLELKQGVLSAVDAAGTTGRADA